MKCNDSPTVLALLAQLGTGFDCASKVCDFMILIPNCQLICSCHLVCKVIDRYYAGTVLNYA